MARKVAQESWQDCLGPCSSQNSRKRCHQQRLFADCSQSCSLSRSTMAQATTTSGCLMSAHRVQTRLTFGPVENDSPARSRDGKWIVYTSVESNVHTKLYRKPSKGAEELLLFDDQVAVATDWSQDGKYLLHSRGLSAVNWEIWALPLKGEPKPCWWYRVPRTRSPPRGISPRMAIGLPTRRKNLKSRGVRRSLPRGPG
jgi:WD40 repeat protein